MFVDSSVIVAVLADEADAPVYLRRIVDSECTTSALVFLESAMRLSTLLLVDPIDVAKRIQAFLTATEITIVPIDPMTADLAVRAFAQYGKGRGHQAQLNLADCLAYACAKAQGAALLYKGNDFLYTDLA